MRAPGSIHQKTGQPVTARRLRSEPFALEAFDALVGFDAVAQPEHATQPPLYDLSVNGDVIGSARGLFSYARAAQQCGAMREAAQGNGAGTPGLPRCLESQIQPPQRASALTASVKCVTRPANWRTIRRCSSDAS